MGINSILRKAGFLVLILIASIFATLLPDLIKIPRFPPSRSDTLNKSSYPAQAQTRKDPRLSAIEEAVGRTPLEGKQVIEKARLARPEFERGIAAKTLEEMIEDSTRAEGLYRIEPLGWDASKMKDGRWRLTFHYHRWPSLYLVTEWEYDHRADKLYLLNSQHGAEFWMTVANLQALKDR